MKDMWKYIKTMYKLTKKHNKYLFTYLAVLPILSAIAVIIPLLEAKQITYVNNSIFKQLFWVSILILTIELSRNVFSYFSRLSLWTYFNQSMRELKMRVLKAVVNIKNKSLDAIPSGVIIERVNKDCDEMADIIPVLIENLMEIVTNLGVIVTVFCISKIFFFFFLGGSLIIYMFKNIRTKKLYKFSIERSKKEKLLLVLFPNLFVV